MERNRQDLARNTSRVFDERHPPDPELIADCVHCGFCLPTCPTYLLWGEEMDSPRGRIQLMKMASNGEIGMTEHFVRHMDQCLGCMACVTACPSGVQYNKLIEATRPQVERRAGRKAGERIFRSTLFQIFPYPRRLRALLPLLFMYQKLGMARLVDSPLGKRMIPHRLRGIAAVVPTVHLSRKDPPAGVPFVAARGGDEAPRRRAGVLLG